MMLAEQPIRRRDMCWVLAAVASFIAMGAAHSQGDAAKHLAPKGELRVAMIMFNSVLVSRGSDGQLGGLSVELANVFGDKLGVPVRLVPYENQVRYNLSIGKDEWDIGFVPRDLSRTSQLAFSDVVL